MSRTTITSALLSLLLPGCGKVTYALGDDNGTLSPAGTDGAAEPIGSGGTSSTAVTNTGGAELSMGGATLTGGTGNLLQGDAMTYVVGDCNQSTPTGCPAGMECFRDLEDASSGQCAPLCDRPEQQAWGEPCLNDINGEAGTCFPFLKADIERGTLVGTGVCTFECNPLDQRCPGGFSCDITEQFAGTEPPKVFACLPLVRIPYGQEGEACNGSPQGQCGPGLTCIDTSYVCQRFCDLNAPSSCADSQTCTRPAWFPAEPANVGVCEG